MAWFAVAFAAVPALIRQLREGRPHLIPSWTKMATKEQVVLASAVVAVPLIWRLGGIALNRYFTRHFTVAYDIPQVAFERDEGKRIKGAAVVCGGRCVSICLTRTLNSDAF